MTTTARTTDGYLGVTPPISTAEPTETERKVTVTLMEELRAQRTFEAEEESKNREIALAKVTALVKRFVKKVSKDQGLSDEAAEAAGGTIHTFGSYRLGVHAPGADIDTLCVVPKHVSRESFFEVFEKMLKEEPGVTEVSAVSEAYVPVIKAEVNGISFDFLIARLALSSVPDSISLSDDNLLRNIDERCIRSLNGSRVADEILNLVPNPLVFRDALRCIKLWATRRAIYSNVNGFLGGVGWAMLVARICQLYPSAVAGSIVSRFFLIMYQWPWPKPVILKQIEDGPLNVRVWNPVLYPADRAHRMPIITPAYPSMCATHNVTVCTHEIMKEELKKGAAVVDKVMVGTGSWSELFVKHDFFHKYRYYLQITASAEDEDIQLKWSGTVESRVRQLVMKLENVESLRMAHPFVKGFDQTLHCISDAEVSAVAQGEVSDAIRKRQKLDLDGVSGSQTVYTTTFYIGLAIEPKQPGASGPRKLDISYPTSEFTKMVKMWDNFDGTKMGIVVRHIKSALLPDYCFGPGERQPKPAQKRPKPTKAEQNNNPSPEMPSKKQKRESNPANETNGSAPLSAHKFSIAVSPTDPLVEPLTPSAGVYSSAVQDPSTINAPQLPFPEKIAAATGTTVS